MTRELILLRNKQRCRLEARQNRLLTYLFSACFHSRIEQNIQGAPLDRYCFTGTFAKNTLMWWHITHPSFTP